MGLQCVKCSHKQLKICHTIVKYSLSQSFEQTVLEEFLNDQKLAPGER